MKTLKQVEISTGIYSRKPNLLNYKRLGMWILPGALAVLTIGMSACGGSGTNFIVVDQANAKAADTSCGTVATPCKTITEGLAAAAEGQTVLVNPGTYIEQLIITKNITLLSATPHTAIVKAPAVLATDSELGGSSALVKISGGATATIANMTIEGPVGGSGGCGSIGYGLFVANANATIEGNQVLSIRDGAYSGCQNGVAIRFGAQALGFVGHTGTISNNTVKDYNKAGIVVDGKNTNVSVISNVVVGQNQPAINGQNGIQISRGAIGLVDKNTISNNRYADTPLTQSAAGILIYNVTNGLTVTNNNITGNDEGIGVYSDAPAATNVIIKNNTVKQNAVLGIHIDANSSGNTIWTNTVQANGVYDAADEHQSSASNDWGTSVSSNNNVIGSGPVHTGSFTF